MTSKIIEKAYLFFLLLLPFVYFSTTIDPALIPRQIFLSLFLLFIILLLKKNSTNYRYLPLKNPLYIAILGYFVFSLFSYFQHNFTSESHYVLSKQLIIFAFFIVSTHVLYNKLVPVNQLIIAIIGLGIITILGAYYDLIIKLISGEKLLRRAGLITSFFANKNLVSSILFLCFPFFLMGLSISKKIRFVSIIGLLSALPILIILGTRAVFLALLIFLLIISIYYLKTKFRIRNRFIVLGCLLIVIVGVFLLKNYVDLKIKSNIKSNNAIEQYVDRLTNLKTFNSRTEYWNNSISLWQENPLFGVGMGNWQVDFPKYGLDKYEDFAIINGINTIQRPHNDFLNILCENGILSLISYCIIFLLIYYQLLFLLKNEESKTVKWKYIYLLTGISGYIIISFFDFPMERIEHQVILMIFFAMITSRYYEIKSIKKETNRAPLFLHYFLLFIVFYSLIIGLMRFKGETETAKMYVAKNNAQWDDTYYFANQAENYFYKIDPTSIPLDWYKGIAYFNKNEIGKSILFFESAYQKAPYQIQVLNNLASSYAINGEKEKAKQYYWKALHISPKFEEARLNLAASYYNDKKYEKAFENIDKIDITNSNKRYKTILIPILAKKLNLVLMHENDINLSTKLAKEITKSQQLYNLYYQAKQNNISFEKYILNQKN